MILGISSYKYGWNVGLTENMPQITMLELDLENKYPIPLILNGATYDKP
jgi:hypothetical protein